MRCLYYTKNLMTTQITTTASHTEKCRDIRQMPSYNRMLLSAFKY